MEFPSRRQFLGAAAVLAACGEAGPRKPNIVLLVTDDQGYGDLGCHGNSVIKTPHMDRLYAESVRFTDFHVDPLCAPTRAGLMTGRYAYRCGVTAAFAGRSIMRLEETTVAEILKANGYRTGLFGKWHLGDNYPFRPNERGFDETVVAWSGGVVQAADAWGNDYFDDRYSHNNVVEQYEGYCTDVFFREGLEWVEREPDEPFFLYLPLNAPHGPYWVDEKYSKPYADQGVPAAMAAFYGMIENIDENLGALRERLERRGLLEDTIFIFMTDNGTAAGTPTSAVDGRSFGNDAGMRGRKGRPYDGGHRVPFFVSWPARGIGGGRDVGRLAAGIDVVPTLVDLAGLELPKPVEFDGVSLGPLLRGAPGFPEGRVHFTQHQQFSAEGVRQMDEPRPYLNSAALDERWRLVDGKELYDIEADPGQANDVSAEHPEEVARLRAAYDAWWSEVKGPATEYVEIPVGDRRANPVRLTSFDWRPDGGPANQNIMRMPLEERAKRSATNGFWAVRLVEAGRYALTLRERPPDAGYPIERVARARISIGGFEHEQAVPIGAQAVRFEAELKAGSARLETWLEQTDGGSRGAYFVDVERL